MADIPSFSDAENLEQFREKVGLEKQMTDEMREQNKIRSELGRINKVIEREALQSSMKREDMLKSLQKLNENYYSYAELGTRNLLDTEMEKFKHDLESADAQRRQLINRIKLSREVSDIQKQMAKEQHEEDTKWYKFATSKTQELAGLKFEELSLAKKTGDELMAMGIESAAIAYTFGAILMMVKGSYDLFNKMDKAAAEFRISMGMTRLSSMSIRKDAESLAIDYMSMGITIDGVYKSYKAIERVVGGVHNVTKAMARDVALMSVQLGVAEEISVGFMRNLAVVSGHSMESQANMMGLAQAMSAAAGVNLGEVMKDIATKSDTSLMLMSRMPNVALRTAIELRRMGTSMKEAADAGSHVLDFTQSINDEMEASVLLGRSVNFQSVRQLTYARDLEGAAKRTVELARQNGFAHKMDYFQMKAFAQLSGYSVDQLLNMVQVSEQIDAIKRGTNMRAKEELANYEKMRRENEAAAKARAKDGMEMVRTMANQQRIVQIQNKWNQLMAKAQSVLLPIIDGLLAGALAITDWIPAIMAFMAPLGTAFGWVGKWLQKSTMIKNVFGDIGYKVFEIGIKFEKVGIIINAMGEWISSAFSITGKILGFAGKFLGLFGKWIPVIGWVIMGFQFIGNQLSEMNKYFTSFGSMSWGQRIGQGLLIIPKAIEETVIQPFIDAYKSVMRWWGGHSPSLLGMGIVRGIISIGTMLFNALTSPFRMAFGWIINKFSGIGQFIGKVFGQASSVEHRAQAAYIPAVTVTPNGTQIETPKAKAAVASKEDTATSQVMSEETGKKMVALLEKILAKDTNIKMDGQLLSATLARNTEFRGGYGVNKVA